jgi:hypothetical protein
MNGNEARWHKGARAGPAAYAFARASDESKLVGFVGLKSVAACISGVNVSQIGGMKSSCKAVNHRSCSHRVPIAAEKRRGKSPAHTCRGLSYPWPPSFPRESADLTETRWVRIRMSPDGDTDRDRRRGRIAAGTGAKCAWGVTGRLGTQKLKEGREFRHCDDLAFAFRSRLL